MLRNALVLACVTLALGSCDLSGEKTADLDKRVSELETQLEDAQAAAKHISATQKKADDLEKRVATTESELAAIEKRSASDEQTLETLRTELDGLKMEIGKVAEKQATAAAKTDEGEELPFEKVGVAECDEYMTKYYACVQAKMPESSKETTLKALRTSAEAWQQAAKSEAGKKALAEACKSALETAKKAFSSMGCEF